MKFIPDPNNPDILIPITVNEVGYTLDDRGRTFGKLNDVSCCRFGCAVNVKALYECSHCRESVCKKHTFFVGKRVYCRKGACAWAGRTYQLFRGIYRMIRFCFASVTGIEIPPDEDNSLSERELVGSSSDEDTLNGG